MSIRRTRKNSKVASRLPSIVSSSPTALNSLLDCYDFLAPNEYSEKTFGILAFLLRKSVGTINFSEIIDEAEKRNQRGPSADFVTLLEDRRKDLPKNDASIEKCLMLNRFISYIQENETRFSSILSHIRLDMKKNMMDDQLTHDIQYPEDFRRREADFFKRKKAQDMRRLFYFSHSEANEPSNLIHLQNRTTEHLSYLIESKMRNNPTSQDTGFIELEKIFSTSFMIIAQPHFGVKPVLVYNRRGSIFTAKVSVIIISLLHDFMQRHPNMIELYDIEPILSPPSDLYKLNESQKLSWKTCHLQACLGVKPQIIQYAKLSSITIQQTYKDDTRAHFAQVLHTLKFAIKLQVNLIEDRFSKIHQITLESLPFTIGQHNSQIPQLLTRVILDDIKRFSKPQSITVKTILSFILRYFIHRTGVEPHEDHKIYLEQELNKAMKARKNFQTLEDIFMDFLVPYVCRIEFMAQHPILAMLYADGLFLGICNRERVAEVMKKSSDENLSKVGLRFNSIEIDYTAIATMSALGRIIKSNTCAIRMDTYNNRKKTIRYGTFESTMLSNYISSFASKALSENLSHIRILCNFDDKTNDKTYKSFAEFSKYYDSRLHELSKNEERYTVIPYLACNFDDDHSGDSLFDDDDYSQNTDSSDQHSFISDSVHLASATTFDDEHSFRTTDVYDYMPMFDIRSDINKELSMNVLFPSEQQQQPQFVNNQDIVQYFFSQPDLAAQIVRQFNELNLTTSIASPQQQQYNKFQTFKIETCDKASSVSEIEDFSTQTEKELYIMEPSTEYFENSPSSLHSIRLHKTSANSLVVESTPACCTELVGMALTTTSEYGSNQNPSICPAKLKQNVGILVVYLGALQFSSIENNITITRKIEFFQNEHSCISKLWSTKRRVIYFIISATLAKTVIPLIHNCICIEHIYIHQDGNITQNSAFIDGYSKIRGIWSSIEEIVEQVERDISSIETRPNRWSRTPQIFEELWTQKPSTLVDFAVMEDIKQTYEMPTIVTLCGIHPAPFDLSKDGIKTYQFSAVEDCHQFIKEQRPSSTFLIIICDYNVIFNEIKSLVICGSIHAVYVFPINNDNDKHYEAISVCASQKISGIFYQEKDLLLQLVTDICFFRQLPTHIPKMSTLKIEFDILSTLDDDKKAFLNFQFLIDILKQLWCAPGVPSEISDGIEAAGTDLSPDLYTNNIQLTLAIDRLIKQFDPVILVKAASHFRLINQHLESSIQKIYPFSITVYRVQLLSAWDLQVIQNTASTLFAIHTFVLASRSYSLAKSICRRAIDNGLTAVLLEVNIPKNTPLTYLDSDIIIFPLCTVFKIILITTAPDKICHVQMELADSTMDFIYQQLYYTIGENMTWLTFGNYLARIGKIDVAEEYFDYMLKTFQDDSRVSASIYNNRSLMYSSTNGKDEEAFDCLKKAKDLTDIKATKVSEKRTEHTEKHSETHDKVSQYEKLAELYEQEGDCMYACLFYEKALKCTMDPTVRKTYQLKIETLNVKK